MSKRKKIIFMAQSYGGGVTEYLYMLLKGLDKNKYCRILLFSEEYKEQEERFKKISDKIYYIPMTREVNLKKDIIAIKQTRKIIKDEQPNIVYAHSSKAGAIARIALYFNPKIKILYNAHGWYFNADISNKKKKVFLIIEKLLALRTSKIINISQNEYDTALKNKVAKQNKMCIIENGIDLKKFTGCEENRKITRKKYNIDENDIVIGTVGRISEQKDPLTAIKAFKLLHEKYSNTKFIFVGDGNLKQKITEYARQNNINNDIIITNWVDNVEKYIPAFDIAILPSKWEGFGLVLIEYMACKKPIIASNVGGIPNIIKENENGFLIKPGDYQELFIKIKEIIENENIKEKFIHNNEKVLERYDIKKVIEKHEELFDNL